MDGNAVGVTGDFAVEREALNGLTRQALDLLEYASRANIYRKDLLGEMDGWGRKLEASVAQTGEHISAALATADQLDERVHNELKAALAALDEEFSGVAQTLDRKARDILRILKSIEDIGQRSNLLAVSASIEAAASGKFERGFGVVAADVRALAEKTMESARLAGDLMDLTQVQEQIRQFSKTTADSFRQVAALVERTNQRLSNLFLQAEEELSQIAANNRVVSETLEGVHATSLRSGAKIVRARQVTEALVDAVQHPQAREEIRQVAARNQVHTNPAYDRLADIRRRGFLRAAIEPNFMGLSFRTGPQEPLRGFDAEFVRAFAGWLGVECQFVEHPWDQCPQLLWTGRTATETEADLMTTLPPSAAYKGVAYSDSYLYIHYVLARRAGDHRIAGADSLAGKALGCVNDQAVFSILEDAGIRWSANAGKPGGRIRLGNLVPYSDQTRIHTCLIEGAVDAFAVDAPIYYWAACGADSPFKGKIDILPQPLTREPLYYAVGVAAHPGSATLLQALNQFIAEFMVGAQRRDMETRWMGQVTEGQRTYRDEPGNLPGQTELAAMRDRLSLRR